MVYQYAVIEKLKQRILADLDYRSRAVANPEISKREPALEREGAPHEKAKI
jgi:hypothetical protein